MWRKRMQNPATDLRLALGNSNNTTVRRLNNDSGAGANAASNIGMTFVATDPLSELVWSPQRGLCLKCTERSFLDKRPSYLSGARPSNVFFPARVVGTDKRMETDYFGNKSMFHTDTRVSNLDAFQSLSCCSEIGRASSSGDEGQKGCGGCFMEERDSGCKESFLHLIEKNDRPECSTVHVCAANDCCIAKGEEAKENVSPHFPEEQKIEAQLVPLPKSSVQETRDIDARDRIPKLKTFFTHGENKIEAGEVQGPRDESTLFKEGETEKAMKKAHFSSQYLFEKLETAAENDFPSTVNKKGHVATGKIRTSESDFEVRRKSQQGEVDLNSRIKCGKKCKKKKNALSDGNVKGRATSEDEDDSHESVESCNSAGISRVGKRRWSFEEQLIVGSKIVKQQIQETPGSSSFIKQDSSFMNWISNMVKGSPKPKPEVPALALTLSDCNQGLENPHQDLVAYNENTRQGFQNNGFQSIFHSIYSPKLRVQEPRAPNESNMLELDISHNICETDATPVACNGENIQLGEIFPLPKDSEACSRKQVEVPPSGGIKTNSESYPEENGVSFNVPCAAQKDGTSSSSYMGKGMILAAVNIDSDPASEGKAAYDVSYRSDPLGNGWISPFVPKILSDKDTKRQTTDGALEFPNYLMVSRQQCEVEPLTVSNEGFKGFMRNFGASAEFSKIKNKLETITTSPRLNNSEAMASLLARRLDALKHIVTFGVTENAALIPATCFFCGKKGHQLRECSEITEADLRDLVNNMKPYNGGDGFPFLCIRCFQLNHWAVSCPKTSSRVLTRGKRKYDEEDLRSHTNRASIGAQTIYSTLDSKACHDLNHLMTADRIWTATGLQETFKASSSRIVESKEGFISPLDRFTGQKLSEMPKGISDAIKKLRLSRTDILRCMSAEMTLSSLDGFFVRLRLGKWQERLPSTGYYAACISGTEENEEIPDASSKSCIHVNVGGVTVLVESQYISNHDFLEDELEAWWSTTKRSGCNIPSEEGLRNKVREKRMLGF